MLPPRHTTHCSAQALGTIPFPNRLAWSIEVGRAQSGLGQQLQRTQDNVDVGKPPLGAISQLCQIRSPDDMALHSPCMKLVSLIAALPHVLVT